MNPGPVLYRPGFNKVKKGEAHAWQPKKKKKRKRKRSSSGVKGHRSVWKWRRPTSCFAGKETGVYRPSALTAWWFWWVSLHADIEPVLRSLLFVSSHRETPIKPAASVSMLTAVW